MLGRSTIKFYDVVAKRVNTRFNKLINYKTKFYLNNKSNNKLSVYSTSSNIESLILERKIIYIGLPFSTPVTELVLLQILWLNLQNPSTKLNFFINTSDTKVNSLKNISMLQNTSSISDLIAYSRKTTNSVVIGKSLGSINILNLTRYNIKRYSMQNSIFSFPLGIISLYNQDIKNLQTYQNEIIFMNNYFTEKLFNRLILPSNKNAEQRIFDSTKAKKLGLIDEIISCK